MPEMTLLTLDAFLDLAETKPANEYAAGEVFQKPMPGGPHAAIQGFFVLVLHPFLARTGLGRVFPELRCIFGPSGRERAYVPDVVYVAQAKLPLPRHLHAAPDLAIEVLSPDQHLPQFLDKIHFYLLYGVRLVWVIDPATRRITVETPGEEARILGAGDMLDGGEVLPGFSVAVEAIFAEMPL